MKGKIRFTSIKARLIFWFLLVALLPLIVTSIIISQQRTRVIKENAFHKLTAVRDLKADEINNWLDERIGDIKVISQDSEIRTIGEVFDKPEYTEIDTHILRNAEKFLNSYVEVFSAYEEIFIINPISAKTEISTNRALTGLDKSQNQNFTEPMRTGDVYVTDIYYSKTTHRPSMTFSIPIFSKGEKKRIAGILVARIDLESSLYDLLLDRTGMGNTGETLIVNKDGMALSELRWHSNAPLKLKIGAKPALMASQGKSGIAETDDYRGEQVLAAYTYIPRTQWGFVAKQDLKEVYASIQEMLLNIVILFLISAVVVYLLAFFVVKNFVHSVHEMTEVSRRIQEGDIAARNHMISEDELGYLAQSFNNMADSIGSQLRVQGNIADLNKTMVVARGMQEFTRDLLKKLIETTNSNLGAFHLLTEDGTRFEHFTSLGVSRELLEPFDAIRYEGELGRAVAVKEISHIKDIPEDSVFKFKTFTGTLSPKEIITVPITLHEKVVAVISLASLRSYSKESLGILNQTLIGMNIAFSNLVAGEQTEKLVGELGQKNQELAAQSEELQTQAEELKKTAEELQGQNVELELQGEQVKEANRLKSEFLSNMSHELRTPLNSVMALSRVLIMQAKEKLSEEETGYLEIIERNGKQLLNLINDILDLSKIESGKMEVNLKFFSPTITIDTIVESLEQLAEDKGIDIIQELPDNLPKIESDEFRVHQILQNIMGNAVKFTNQGKVIISAFSDAGKINIKVKDTGIGISENDRRHIFDEFRQVDGSSARRFEGTGLGLTIAHKAVKILGGDISVESALGKGSAFMVTLPVKWEGPSRVYEQKAVIPSVQIKPERKTILIVDDEPAAVTMISGYLAGEGYNTITATSGKEALKLARSHHPFAITLDIIMPETDGWEVLQELKLNPGTADIPVIIISISGDQKTGLALGAVGYITKPVNKDVLISEIFKISGMQTSSVMIVDDNEIDRKETARIIQNEGIKAIVADGGPQCLQLLKKALPDVIVLDLMMPDIDGFEVLERIRNRPDTVALPVVVVTAKDLTDEDRRKLTGNVSSILAKSDTTRPVLLAEIKKILSSLEQSPEPVKTRDLDRDAKILLVEDNQAVHIQVKFMLESENYLVDIAENGQEALDYVKHTIPDGIILDLMMPEVDGFEVLENIRSTEATANIPVLVLTAKDLTPDDLNKLSANNIRQLIHKGDVDRENLLFKIRQMLGLQSVLKPRGKKIRSTVKIEPLKKTKVAGAATILVVEDNPDNLTTIKAILQSRCDIIEAADGEEGLTAALTKKPDLVLLDMSLPKMDGFSVVKKIKEDQKARHIPVIALTARAMKGDREKTLEAGCDDYISKPIDPEKILKKIDQYLDFGD